MHGPGKLLYLLIEKDNTKNNISPNSELETHSIESGATESFCGKSLKFMFGSLPSYNRVLLHFHHMLGPLRRL